MITGITVRRSARHDKTTIGEMRVALIQGDIQLGNPEANHQHMQNLLEQAVEQYPDLGLAVLPEMWNTGYALEQIHELADPEGQKSRSGYRHLPRSIRYQLSVDL